MPIQARTEFAAALNQIASEKGVDVSVVIEAIEQAALAAYRKDLSLRYYTGTIRPTRETSPAVYKSLARRGTFRSMGTCCFHYGACPQIEERGIFGGVSGGGVRAGEALAGGKIW